MSRKVRARHGSGGKKREIFKRYGRRPPPRRMSATNAATRWSTFRSVKVAIRTLAHYGLPRTPQSVHDATRVLAGVVPGVSAVPIKTILDNELSRYIYEGWKTTKPRARSVARPTVVIPRSLRKKGAAELRVMFVQMKAKFETAERGRLEAIAAQSTRTAPGDALDLRMRIVTAAMEAALAAEASLVEAGGEGAAAVEGEAERVGE